MDRLIRLDTTLDHLAQILKGVYTTPHVTVILVTVHMSHHFQDIAKYWSKIGKCSCPPVANSPVRVTQSEYHLSFWCEKIRNIGLTAVMTEIKSVCDRDKVAAPAGDGV